MFLVARGATFTGGAGSAFTAAVGAIFAASFVGGVGLDPDILIMVQRILVLLELGESEV